MVENHSVAPQARLLVGMGGSGIKTLAEFVSLLTQHTEEARRSELFMAYLLVDTDAGELATAEKEIREAYQHVHREPIVATVHLSADITDFAAFVASKLSRSGHHDRLKEVWWYRTDRPDEPFTAINLKDSPTRGAGQCPLVSTFLAWNQMRQIESTIDELLNTLKNRAVQGENKQNWTLDVSVVAGLAGGTGRGCWHLVASKIREKLRDLNIRPKPVGFFYDSSVFAETVKREEQVTKLRVNSLTGVSELVAWLRNEYERDTDLAPHQFRLPSLDDPAVSSSDLVDTTKLNATVSGETLQGVSGRAPVSAAYLIFGAGKQGTLGEASAYFKSVANALYARLFISTASKNINEAGHLNGLAAATISVSIAGVQEYVREYVKEFLPTRFSEQLAADKAIKLCDAIVEGIFVSEYEPVVPQFADERAANVPQRVYKQINNDTGPARDDLDEKLRMREYEDAEALATEFTTWAETNEAQLKEWVRQDLAWLFWGRPSDDNSNSTTGGALRRRFGSERKLGRDEYHALFSHSDEGDGSKATNPVSKAVRELLEKSKITLKSEDRTEDLDISSYGTKLAIARGLVQRLDAMIDRITDTALPRPLDGEGTSPEAEFKRARTGLFKTGVTAAERGTIVRSVEPWVLGSANQVIQAEMRRLLGAARDDIQGYANATRAVVERLEAVANGRKEETKRLQENNFWGKEDFNKILDQGESAFDQQILSNQVLQAVARNEELEEAFSRVMQESSSEGFGQKRGEFVEAVNRWIDARSSGSGDPQLDRKLPDLVAEHLGAMANQFMLPDNFYEKNFGFFETVKRLVRSWGDEMVARMGSPQDKAKLAQVFKNQFGIDYPSSVSDTGGPKRLDEEDLRRFTQEVCRSMAVRLGGRCDPLFQQRFDEGERPTYDNVCVVFPTEKEFDDEFAEDVEDFAKENHQFQGAGNFAAVKTFGELDAGNPYTMFAYATQQFEDWRSDSGMSRIASLEYYKTPAVLNWLRACEDPSGASVFLDSDELRRFGIKSCRDIYGLGYISPLFVRDRTLKELRWSPWDESKARSANKRNDRLDLLAYSLLEPPQALEGSRAESVRHFHDVLRKAEWSMPLLALPDSTATGALKSWQFTRPAVRHCTEVTATKERDANHPAFEKGHAHSSIRRCVDELLENDMVAEAIAGEAAIFMSEVLCNDDYADDFHPEEDIEIAFAYLRDRLKAARSQQTGPAAERMTKLIDELLARVKDLEGIKPEKLREHFEGIRRNTELHSRA